MESDKRGATTKDILVFAEKRFGALPEYLWQKFPDYFVFRSAENNKWFAVIGSVEYAKLGIAKDGITDVMAVKCSPEARDILLHEKGVIPAYHMNKERWISIVLDGTCRKDLVFGLLEESFNLIHLKGRAK